MNQCATAVKKHLLGIVCLLFTQFGKAQNFETIVFKTLPQKLGNEINSDEMEGEPKLSPDGKVLYFCRRNDANNIGGPDSGADIWFSVKEENGLWQPAKNLGTPVNDRNFNQVIGIRADGNGMIVKGSFDSHTLNDIYITRRAKGKWQKPEPIAIEGITKRLINATYSVSTDFNVLFIASNKLDGIGKDDIYISFLVADGVYSEPKNIGNVLNTINDEVFPVLASDNKTLYFSSNGHA
ncbi:MAG TPA: hypothetical protein DCQ31_13085, partial [Bacteroidales bacterium]|nr:hypothetical protein [Bacteroidales bacterium]